MKKIILVSGIAIVFFACLAFVPNPVIKSVVTAAVSRITGAPVRMDGFSLDYLRSTIQISGFKIYNPAGFPPGVLVSCPKIKIVYDRDALLKKRLHFLLMEIELREMVLTKNKEGKLSVDSLKIVQQAKSLPPTFMSIDLLTLSIGRIVTKDYSVGAEPSVRVREVNRHKSYKGIPTAQQLTILVLSEPMKAAAIKNAKIYGVAMLAGVGVLPVAVAATLIEKDSVSQVIDHRFEHVYEISLEVAGRMGTVTRQDASAGVIKARIRGAMVAILLKKQADHRTKMTVSARKYLFPKLDMAGGVLYQILDRLQ